MRVKGSFPSKEDGNRACLARMAALVDVPLEIDVRGYYYVADKGRGRGLFELVELTVIWQEGVLQVEPVYRPKYHHEES